ncbi:MAG TPA: toll/interleukin-1 receptor domain-containing protein [Candidatus Angelobacter sp.]
MDVFISWSGERSRAAAEALRGWLPKIINAIKPWLSSEDIDKGSQWGTDVASRLEAAKAGIICLTPGNLHSDWILFEAGALSKTLQNTYVCPFLIGLEPSDVKPPLAQFQATKATKDDVLKLLKTLNTALGDNGLTDAHIAEAFEVWWPKLESQLLALPGDDSKAQPHRSERDLLEEILALVRNQNRRRFSMPYHLLDAPIGDRTGTALEDGTLVEVREEIEKGFQAKGEKVMRVVLAFGRGGAAAFDQYIVQTDKGDEYSLQVPATALVDEAVATIRSQIQTTAPNIEHR